MPGEIKICKKCFSDNVSTVCNNCGNPDYFTCDDGIADVIILLNKLGYTTEFCCEGHLINKYEIYYPYIKFKKPIPFELYRKIHNNLLKEDLIDSQYIKENVNGNKVSHFYIPPKLEYIADRFMFNRWKTYVWENVYNTIKLESTKVE